MSGHCLDTTWYTRWGFVWVQLNIFGSGSVSTFTQYHSTSQIPVVKSHKISELVKYVHCVVVEYRKWKLIWNIIYGDMEEYKRVGIHDFDFKIPSKVKGIQLLKLIQHLRYGYWHEHLRKINYSMSWLNW